MGIDWHSLVLFVVFIDYYQKIRKVYDKKKVKRWFIVQFRLGNKEEYVTK